MSFTFRASYEPAQRRMSKRPADCAKVQIKTKCRTITRDVSGMGSRDRKWRKEVRRRREDLFWLEVVGGLMIMNSRRVAATLPVRSGDRRLCCGCCVLRVCPEGIRGLRNSGDV